MVDLALIIINDGDGSQCGYNYHQRCNHARLGGVLVWVEMAQKCSKWAWDKEKEGSTSTEILKGAYDAERYYQNHVKELENDQKI